MNKNRLCERKGLCIVGFLICIVSLVYSQSCSDQDSFYMLHQNLVSNGTVNSVLVIFLGKHQDDQWVLKQGSIFIPDNYSIWCQIGSLLELKNSFCRCRILEENLKSNVSDSTLKHPWILRKTEDGSFYMQHRATVVRDDNVISTLDFDYDRSQCFDSVMKSVINSCFVDSMFSVLQEHKNNTTVPSDLPCQNNTMIQLYGCVCNGRHCPIIEKVEVPEDTTGVSYLKSDNYHCNQTKGSYIGHLFVDYLDFLCHNTRGKPSPFPPIIGIPDAIESDIMYNLFSLELVDLILTVTSLLSVLLTILVFAVCPELRNLHGKNLVSLSITLSFSQVLFLHDTGIRNPSICAAIGGFLHFCWLSVFAWTSVIAFDLARTFRLQGNFVNPTPTSDYGRRFLAYAGASWGGPALFVITSVSVDISITHKMYGARLKSNVCMVSRVVLIYGVLVPLCLAFIFNIICFVIIVHGIETQKKNRPNGSVVLSKTRLVIYVKLSVLLGLSWLFCLLATVHDNKSFWLSFSVMSNIQGLGIFVSFVLMSRRVKNLLIKTFRKPFSSSNFQLKLQRFRRTYQGRGQGNKRASTVSENIHLEIETRGRMLLQAYDNPAQDP